MAANYTLSHPIYLDVPMMISFLAAIEGGVALSEEGTATETGSRERLLKARTGLRARILGLGDADLGAEAATQRRDESSFVAQTQRHHTAASLSNVLYGYLREDGLLLDVATIDDIQALDAGQLVQMTGEYLGNPLEDVLVFFDALFKYVNPDEPKDVGEPVPVRPPSSSKRTGSAKKAAAAAAAPAKAKSQNDDNGGIKIMKMMAADLGDAPVHDVLFRTPDGLDSVVTAASEFYTAVTTENLREGQFQIVGKITRVLQDGDSLDLTRRTVMGAAGPALAQDTLGEFNKIKDFSLKVANPIVSGPALQVLPMAIFV